MFKRKRCKQCGWELKLFTRQDFCGEMCVSVWDRNKREYEEAKRRSKLKHRNEKEAVK